MEREITRTGNHNRAKQSNTRHKAGTYEKYIKRLLDILCSAVALIILSPVLLITAILVRVKLGSPVIFSQERPGKDEKIFKLYKFRTMTDERDENGDLLPDEVRLTKFGKMLRATSLDELPELVNVLKGEMSVIGPRPLLIQYLPRYNAHQARRHEVRPGITGYAQVRGRNTVSWIDKFNYDVEYVDNITFLGDVKILIDTVKTVIKRDGISSETSVTMEEFMGKKLLLIGASGHGKVVADIAIRNGYEVIGFLDDNPDIKEIMGFPVLGKVKDAISHIGKADMCVSIGNAQIRRRIMESLIEQGATLPTLTHPDAVIGMNVEIGAGTVAMAGTVINPDAKIGRGCIINTCASVDHDCIIGDYAHISVGARVAGTVEIGEGTWVGAGAVIMNNLSICGNCMIGAGAVVVCDIKEQGTYVGVPAKRMK